MEDSGLPRGRHQHESFSTKPLYFLFKITFRNNQIFPPQHTMHFPSPRLVKSSQNRFKGLSRRAEAPAPCPRLSRQKAVCPGHIWSVSRWGWPSSSFVSRWQNEQYLFWCFLPASALTGGSSFSPRAGRHHRQKLTTHRNVSVSFECLIMNMYYSYDQDRIKLFSIKKKRDG